LAAVSLEFSLNNQFLLTIRNTAPVPEENEAVAAEEEGMDEADPASEEVVAASQD